MLGPMNPAVRPVVSKLCVPVLATTVELLSDTPPRGTQPSFPPSSKSAESVPVSAAATCSVSGSPAGALSVEHATATTPKPTDAKINERKDFTMTLPLSNFWAVNSPTAICTAANKLALFHRPPQRPLRRLFEYFDMTHLTGSIDAVAHHNYRCVQNNCTRQQFVG